MLHLIWQRDVRLVSKPDERGHRPGGPHLGVKQTKSGAKQTFALPDEVEHWSMTTLRGKLIKIGAKVVRPGRGLMHS